MSFAIYKQAVEALPIPKLTAFLKEVEDTVEIEGWAKLRAPEKREQILEAFNQSKELRKEFVAFYELTTGKASDWSEWETGDLPGLAEVPAPAPTPETGVDPLEVAADFQGTDDSPPTSGAVSGEVVEDDPAPEPAPAPATKAVTKTLSAIAVSAFVEGAFEQIVADVAGLDAQSAKISLIEAEDRMEFEHIRIGALLSHIQKSQHYITLGYDNLREFLAAETGLHYRKAVYLIANYDAVKELGIQAVDLKGVTWSALRHIIPILTTKNFGEWLEAARNTTHASLIEKVNQEKIKQTAALAPPNSKPAAPVQLPSKHSFPLYPDQASTVVAAIEKAKTEGNVDSAGAALDIIAAAYTGQPPSNSTASAVLPDMSKAGFFKLFTKVRADQGMIGAAGLLEAIAEVWPEVDISVVFPNTTANAA